jgi:hypothetical protein
MQLSPKYLRNFAKIIAKFRWTQNFLSTLPSEAVYVGLVYEYKSEIFNKLQQQQSSPPVYPLGDFEGGWGVGEWYLLRISSPLPLFP